MARSDSAEGLHSAPSFIGSFDDGPDQVLIVLRGVVDTSALDRLTVHLHDVLAARTRFLTLDASAVTCCDPGLLDLLGRTQRRLARHHGLLTVRGLRPRLLSGAGAAAGSAPDRPAGDPVVPDRESSGASSAMRRVS